MDEDQQQIIKAGAESLFKPFADLIDKLFGGPAEQIGGMMADSLAARRRIRQLVLLKKVKAAIDEAGFEPQRIPDNIWVPVFEAASLEDQETLQQKWANLLANAADPARRTNVLAMFSSILRELTPRQAVFLSTLYEETSVRESHYSTGQFTSDQLLAIWVNAGLSKFPRLSNLTCGEIENGGDALRNEVNEVAITLQVLEKNGVIGPVVKTEPIDLRDTVADLQSNRAPRSLAPKTSTWYRITPLGKDFLRACEPPAVRAETASQIGAST